MSARRIGLVAWHVLKQNVRDRVLYSIAVFALLLVAASLVISQLTAGQDLKMIKDLGLAAIELAGLLMSVTADKVIRIVPPLILTESEAAEIVAKLAPLVKAFLAAPSP